MNKNSPSSGAARHLLPPGEKEESTLKGKNLPSPLVGEGARRAGEGGIPSRPARLTGFSRSMRKNPTEPEKLLWRLLRDRRFASHKFRRQVSLGPYIVDFVCYEAKLVIELDGSQHADCEKDVCRDGWLEANGFSVLRIWNNDLINRQKPSLDAIWHAVSNQEDGK